MSAGQMDETLAAGLRELLVAEVESSTRHWSWLRDPRQFIPVAVAAFTLAAGGGGIAYATGAFTGPSGSTVLTDLAAPVTVTGDGTETVALGPRPNGTTGIELVFTCLSPGFFGYGDAGAGMGCDRASLGRYKHDSATGFLPLEPGRASIKITAENGDRWRMTATYVSSRTTPWAVNASGQTYGVQNKNGTPDLVAAIATNHRKGYVYANQLNPPPPTSISQALAQNGRTYTLTVYESDGRTPIGKFVVGP